MLHVMIGIGTGAENFSTEDALFVATSLASSDSQKKVNSDSEFRYVDVSEEETFIGDVISFMSSALGIQKKESSEMSFV